MRGERYGQAHSVPVDRSGLRERLALNFFPVDLSHTTARVHAGRWSGDAGTLAALVPGLVTWRDPDDGSRMYVWHPTETVVALPGLQAVTVDLDESPKLFQHLVKDGVRARFHALGFAQKSGGYVNYGKPSLLADIPALASATGIGIYPKVMVDVFFTKDASHALVVGLVVDVLYTTLMDVTAAEWVAAGLGGELRGKYVVLVRGSPEAARFPHVEGVVGCVDGIRGDSCVLTDLRDPALAELSLASVAPEPTRQNLASYLAARWREAYLGREGALKRKLGDLVRPKTRYKLARAAVQRLHPADSDGFGLLPGIKARLRDMSRTSDTTFPLRRLHEPTYSFDRGGEKLGRKIDEGITAHGPYDLQAMRRDTYRLLIVAPRENEGDVRLAVQKLLGGVQTDQNVFRGLRTMYRLDVQVTYAFATGPGSPAKRYGDAIHRAIAEAPRQEPPFQLILTVISAAHRDLPDAENPYFQTKALALVAARIPTQAVTIENLRRTDYDLQYVLNTMALACYAKLGGTSHVLRLPEAEDGEATELVFGIGRDVHRTTRLGKTTETIGFATVFRANGEYLYNDCTPYCDDENYERSLEQTIRRTVERIAAFEQLPDGAPLRLIFHVPRRPGRREEGPIMNAVGKLPRFDIKFALLHVNDDHHLQLFDEANISPSSRRKPKPEASLLPARGRSVAIGPRERLVTFIGVDQYRGHGSPAPLRLSLHRRSTFTDVDYLTQQLYLMSFMSARSLNPGLVPVTISYAERLAHLAGRMRGVQQWSVELIREHLGRKLWFI